ncbi:TPA: hypothetical protein I6122_003320 [Vibrio cholerae]|nr:hypothetical protein [Vibrio cholerae]HAS3409658.1 hypothetical protein [Vibrio cholerae]
MQKESHQYFVFPDGSYQAYPNETHRLDAVISNCKPDTSILDFAYNEHYWVSTELNYVDLQVKYHQSSDRRAISTCELWYEYARQLRDYTSIDEHGFPVIVGASRPVRPV